MKEVYTKVIIDLLNSGTEIEEVLTRVKKLMTKKGHQNLYKEVLKAVMTAFEKQKKDEEVLIVVAKEEDKNSELVKNTLSSLKLSDKNFRIEVDETIVGGVTVLYKNQFSDLSYKTSLTKLYRAITT